MADEEGMSSESIDGACTRCGRPAAAWITTCASCGTTLQRGAEPPTLASEPAPPIATEARWIDIPISADEPVRVALFCHFLNERGFPYEESRRFVSIPVERAEEIGEAIAPWAFDHDMPDDPRVHDSLADTLRSIGEVALTAIDRHRVSAGRSGTSESSDGIDLR